MPSALQRLALAIGGAGLLLVLLASQSAARPRSVLLTSRGTSRTVHADAVNVSRLGDGQLIGFLIEQQAEQGPASGAA